MSIAIKLELAVVLTVSFAALALSLENPREPAVPDVPDVTGPTIEDVRDTAMMSNDVRPAGSRIFYQPLWKTIRISESGNAPVEGMLKLTSNFMLTVTNTASNRTSVSHFYISDVVRIEVTKWRGLEQAGGIFKFIPVEYRVLCGGNYVYSGNIPFFNVFEIETNGSKAGAFTIFYDRWVPGQNGQFHWENSRSYDFSYNFTHPLRGVVQTIEFSFTNAAR